MINLKDIEILGYFLHGGTKWHIIKKEGTLLTGFDITPKGAIHKLIIETDQVHQLVLIKHF